MRTNHVVGIVCGVCVAAAAGFGIWWTSAEEAPISAEEAVRASLESSPGTPSDTNEADRSQEDSVRSAGRGSGETTAPPDGGARTGATAGSEPLATAWIGQRYEFPDVGSAEEAAEAFDAAVPELDRRARELFSGERVDRRLGLIKTYASLVRPLLRSDAAAFERAFLDLGASAPGADGRVTAEAFGRLTAALNGAAVDLGSATIDRSPDVARSVPRLPEVEGMSFSPPGGGAAVMTMRTNRTNDAGESDTVHGVLVPTAKLFGIDEIARSPGVVEVFAPARMPGSGSDEADVALSVFLAWDPSDSRWEPAGFRLGLRNDAVHERVEARARKRESR